MFRGGVLARGVRLALAIGLLATFGGSASAASIGLRPVSIRNDSGGQVIVYALKMMKLRESGSEVKFLGRCASACTLYLALPTRQTCIAEKATFRFHAPYGASPDGNRYMKSYILKTYPVWVRDWIELKGGLSSRVLVMDYAYASQFMRKCDGERRAAPELRVDRFERLRPDA